MEVLLAPEEKELVVEVLQESHRTLLKEIFPTHHHEHRDALRKREKLLARILNKLETKKTEAA